MRAPNLQRLTMNKSIFCIEVFRDTLASDCKGKDELLDACRDDVCRYHLLGQHRDTPNWISHRELPVHHDGSTTLMVETIE